jgi:hypothetical protein
MVLTSTAHTGQARGCAGASYCPALGHCRNHVKGICFTGMFEANGAGTALSHAQVFARGRYPVGRFNLGGANLNAPDARSHQERQKGGE